MPTKEELTANANRDPTSSPYYVSILYGDYGNRKTTTACSMVNERGLLMCSDDSWKVLLNSRHSELYSKVKVIPLEGLSQLQYVDFDGYDTIIWDTVSQSIDFFLDLLYDEADWGGKFREQLVTKNPELKGIENLAAADYRVTRDVTRPIFNRLLRQTNAHIVFTSQMTEPLPGLSQNQQKRPAIPAQTFKTLGTRADIIGYLKVNGSKATIDVANGLTQLGKTRFEKIQGQMDLDKFVSTYKEIVFK